MYKTWLQGSFALCTVIVGSSCFLFLSVYSTVYIIVWYVAKYLKSVSYFACHMLERRLSVTNLSSENKFADVSTECSSRHQGESERSAEGRRPPYWTMAEDKSCW